MPQLKAVRRSDHLGRDRETGAAAVFVAVSIIGLLAMTAFAFDFGRMYIEREELQVGADAAALAIAQDCLAGRCTPGYDGTAEAETYVDGNASDGSGWVRDVDIDLTNRTVTVLAGTEDVEGNREFQMVFSPVVGFDDVSIGAQAIAAWGPPGAGTTLPLIFSECEWQNYGASGTVPDGLLHDVADIPFTGDYPYADGYATLYFHGNEVETCHSNSSGQDIPGGFGFLDSGSGCSSATMIGDWVTADPGASPSTGCSSLDLNDWVGTVQLIPYFDETRSSGNNGEYRVLGYGALYVTGYNFAGQFKSNSLIDGKLPCGGSDRCIQGYFIGNWSAPPAGGPGGPDMGVSGFGLIG